MVLWLLGPLAAAIAFAGGFLYERTSERKKRDQWKPLLANDAHPAAAQRGPGLLAGRADGLGRIGARFAPFSGRPCLAYHVEVIARERTPRGSHEEIQWARVYEHSDGYAFVIGDDGHALGQVSFRQAHPLLPEDMSRTNVPGVTIHSSSSSMFASGGLPPHLAAFVQHAHLPPATRDSLFAAGRNLIFNERIVVPGQPLAATGPCSFGPSSGGVLVSPDAQCDVFFSAESAASVRTRVAKIPSGSGLVGGSAAALVVGIMVSMVVAMTSGRSEQRTPSGATTETTSGALPR